MPSAGSDLTARYIAKLQAVDKIDCRPPRCQTVLVDLLEVTQVLADCTAHGRIVERQAPLLRVAQRILVKSGSGESTKVGTINVVPEGLPLGHDLQRPRTFESGAAFRAWWDAQGDTK